MYEIKEVQAVYVHKLLHVKKNAFIMHLKRFVSIKLVGSRAKTI